MPDNFQKKLVEEFQKLIEPLVNAFADTYSRDAFFRAIGWDLETIGSTVGATPVNALQSKLTSIVNANSAITTLLQIQLNTLEDFLNALNKLEILNDAINDLKTSNGPIIMQGFNQLGEDTIEFLITHYFEKNHPVLFNLLALLGLVEVASLAVAANQVYYQFPSYDLVRNRYRMHKLRLDLISSLLSNPLSHFQTVYQLPASGFNWADTVAVKATTAKLFPLFSRFLSSLGIENMVGKKPYLNYTFGPVGDVLEEDTLMIYIRNPSTSVAFGIVISISPTDRGNLGIVITPLGLVSYDQTFGNWQVQATLSASVSTFAISPAGGYTFSPGLDRVGASLDINKLPPTSGAPSILLGSATGTRLQIGEFSVGGNFELSDALREFGFSVTLKDAAFFISPGDGDGFLQKILPANGLQGEFDLKLMWDNIAGFHFEGSGSIELLIPIHKTILNALTIDSMLVAAKIDTQIELITAMSGTLVLGPFTAVFQEVGLSFDFDFPANKDGNLGALNVGVGFKPPKGLGLSMKSEIIKGSGFLSFDNAEGRYVGALELSIKDKITIKAIGILTTKMPGGQPGYSLLLLITAEFQPIQLGFGFTLNGVGGLIALHRRMNTQGLRDGVRNGTIDNILFPTDPVENINSIISSLETVFPIQEGRYTFGPMAIIGWGTPTLITVELGLFFEMPNPQELAIIGVIRAILPDTDDPVLKLQVAFAGIIDFGKNYITFDASIYDSALLGMTLSGDMAFRLKWGDQNTFVLTVGGFHPKFTIPQLDLPVMRRLSLNLCAGDNPRLTLSTYFAVTSNTAQFGAEVDFFWKVTSNLKISGYLGFDALFYFSPFHFIASIQGGLDVKYKSDSILSLSFAGQLEGPTPWHLQGNVTFKFLGIKKTIDFDTTFGQPKLTTLADISVLPLLVAALQDKKNWQATMSTTMPLLVTVRDFTPATLGDVVIHPQGTIAVSQKVVPLDLTIDRFGNRRPDPVGCRRFSIGISYMPTISTSYSILPKTDLKESFAPNEYFDLTEDERLARPSFEPMTSGIQVSNTSNALTSGAYHEIQQDYDLIYMDSRYRPVRAPSASNIAQQASRSFGGNGSAANSPLGSMQQGSSSFAPPTITIPGNQYVIAQTYDLAPYMSYTAGSKTEALAIMKDLVENNPELEGKLNVIHAFEL